MNGKALIAVAFLLPAGEALAQSCNPVLDGTYCAEQTHRNSDLPTRRGASFEPIQGMGQDLSFPGEEPVATFGAITFRGDGKRCIGLLTRGNCR